ncbi:Ig-like domain-containing protein [Paenibacillus sp. IB182496]|uniref:Ig-like domain-containing protein n=1 Tax=Paenibacillus sabuli TaxID=2772509 RepID=A0A927BRR0_9BACL|nr:Ig-like domain-containing protein [Paenibacillus sabuli]MBD2845561.1 Ig-like domain-containing protein [Paenibacillus sabuli]
MKRGFGTILILLLFTLSFSYPPATGLASANGSEDVFAEDFDSYPAQAYPSSLSALSSQSDYTGYVMEDAQTQNRSFRIARTSATTVSTYAQVTLAPEQVLEQATVGVRAMAEQTNMLTLISVLVGENDYITQLAFFHDGKIKAYTDTGWFTVASYSANTWYDFQISVDALTQTFDIYVNGSPLALGLNFHTGQSELRQWRTGIYRGDPVGAIVVDNIRIRDSLIEPPAPEYDEDFERLTPGVYPSTLDPQSSTDNYETVTGAIYGEPGQSMKLQRIESADSSYYVYKTIPAASEDMRISFRARAGQSDATVLAPVIQGQDGVITQIAFFNTGNLRILQGTWVDLWTGYEADRWYAFDIVIDVKMQTFAVWVDGHLLGDNFAFQTAQEGVSRIGFGIYKGEGTASLYVDDIRIEPYVYAPVAQVSLPGGALAIAQGSEGELPITIWPENALFYDVQWSSSEPGIVSVNDDGTVTGLHTGEAIITALLTDTVSSAVYTASRPVSVYFQHAADVQVTPETLTLPVGADDSLSALVLPVDASDSAVIWSSSNETVAQVDAAGAVYAQAPGTAVITATTRDGGHLSSSTVTVIPRIVTDTWYVDAELGSDTNDGSLLYPFRTLPRARDAFRAMRASGEMTGDAKIILRGGVHELNETLLLNEQDSGSAYYNVTYTSYPGEEAVISGGRSIEGWQLYDAENGIYRAPSIGLETRQLYINGIRAIRARSEGTLTEAEISDHGVISKDVEIAGWDRLDHLEFVFQELWTQPRALVQSASVSEDGTTIEFMMQQPGWGAVRSKGATSVSQGPVYMENAYELLDDEGEWYADDEYVYYKPRPFENMSTANVTAPVLEELIRIEGSTLDERVHHIRFEHVVFAYSTWLWPSTSYGLADAQNNHLRYPGQDDQLIDAAVTVRKAHHIFFEGNSYKHLGGTALKLIDGVQDSAVHGNHMYDISGSAINVGEPTVNNAYIYAPPDGRLVMRNVDVTNNYIHDIGTEYAAAAAVSAGFPVDMEISHNHIFNLPYSAIHIGYGWTNFVSAGQKQVRIVNNYIHDLMGAGIYDGGAIYTLGHTGASLADMNEVSGNYLQNQLEKWSVLYADNGSNYWKFSDNVIDQTETPNWGNEPAYWAFGKEKDLLFDNNYTTTNHVQATIASFPVTNTNVHPDANWPPDAQQIIAAAGREAQYQEQYELAMERVHTTKELALQVSETAQISLTGTKDKGQAAGPGGRTVVYRSLQPDIASVTSDGIVEALNYGKATIETTLVQGDLLWTYETEVYIGDQVISMELRNIPSDASRRMILGDTLDPGVYGVTELGRELLLDDLSVTSSDEGVVAIQPDRTLLAVGEGGATVTVAAYGANALTRTFDIEVIQYSSEAGLTVPPYPLNDMLEHTDDWGVSSGSLDFNEGSLRLTTPSGHGYYSGQTFSDELLTFDMTIETEAGWEAITFRNQQLGSPLIDTYAVVIKPNEIELHRFNNGIRTVIFGKVNGLASLGGEAYPNDVLPFGVKRRVQVGAINEEEGVRIVLNVDGRNVFYYLDKQTDRIQSAGYFTVMARFGNVVIGPTEMDVSEP